MVFPGAARQSNKAVRGEGTNRFDGFVICLHPCDFTYDFSTSKRMVYPHVVYPEQDIIDS